MDDKMIKFKNESQETRMIVIGDGDLIKNQVYPNSDRSYSPYPLGYDRFTKQTFGNRDFILNAMNYLVDEDGLISIRSRDVKLRMLDLEKLLHERTYWQVLNTVLPIILILLLGLSMLFYRKYKYGHKSKN